MTEASRTFVFASDAESFTAMNEAKWVQTYDASVGNAAGSLKSTIEGRNSSDSGAYWQWEGTWESLNVPGGSTITHVRLEGVDTKVTAYDTVADLDIGAYSVRAGDDTLIATIWTGRANIGGTDGDWVASGAQGNQAVDAAYEASNTTIRIRLAKNGDLGNSKTAVATFYEDNLAIVVTYTEGVTQVNKDMAAHWDVLELVNDDAALQYDILELVNDDVALQYDIDVLVNDDLALQWDIAALVNDDLALQWDMSGAVNDDLAAQYDILTLVNDDLVCPFDILVFVNDSLALQWNIRELVNDDIALEWDIRGLTNRGLEGQYDILALIADNLTLQYDIEAAGGEEGIGQRSVSRSPVGPGIW